MTASALYAGTTVHSRNEPIRRVFRHPVCLWFVDLDDLPAPPWWLRPLVSFRSADHLGDPGLSLRTNIDVWLAAHGIDLNGGRVTMLAAARSLGHLFNPLSVFWCHRADGGLVCVIAEVCNTYGGRHAYLLRPSADGAAVVDKQFYVSPFLDVRGCYRMRLPEPGDRLNLTIALVDDGRPVFSTVLRGTPTSATPSAVVRAALRRPLLTHRVSLAIRRHGIALWFRGLPVFRRISSQGSEFRL